MSHIKSAVKSERITSITLTSYEGTVDIVEDYYNRGNVSLKVRATNPTTEVLDDLLTFAVPSEDECPPREVTLQSLIDTITEKREALNERYGDDKGTPAPFAIDFSLDSDDVQVVSTVLAGGNIDYNTRSTVRKALAEAATTDNDW